MGVLGGWAFSYERVTPVIRSHQVGAPGLFYLSKVDRSVTLTQILSLRVVMQPGWGSSTGGDCLAILGEQDLSPEPHVLLPCVFPSKDSY